jgi:hypothetical protein
MSSPPEAVTERKAITRAELATVAAGLRRLLDAIAAGDLAAPAGTVNRLERAWLALEALAAGRTVDAHDLHTGLGGTARGTANRPRREDR